MERTGGSGSGGEQRPARAASAHLHVVALSAVFGHPWELGVHAGENPPEKTGRIVCEASCGPSCGPRGLAPRRPACSRA